MTRLQNGTLDPGLTDHLTISISVDRSRDDDLFKGKMPYLLGGAFLDGAR